MPRPGEPRKPMKKPINKSPQTIANKIQNLNPTQIQGLVADGKAMREHLRAQGFNKSEMMQFIDLATQRAVQINPMAKRHDMQILKRRLLKS